MYSQLLVMFTSLFRVYGFSKFLDSVGIDCALLYFLKAWTCVFLAIKLVLFLRGFRGFAWIVAVLSQNVKDMGEFVSILFLCIFFFTFSFMLMFARNRRDDDLTGYTNMYLDGTNKIFHEGDDVW